ASAFFFFQAEAGIRVFHVTGVQTCALPICGHDCDDMGCIEGVTLELATPLTAEGEYTFTVTTESTTTTCVAHIPLRRDGTEPPCDQLSIHRREITTHGDGAVHGVAGDEIEAVGLSGHHDALPVTNPHEG